jgi:predicted permease
MFFLWRKLTFLWRRAQFERDLKEELELHAALAQSPAAMGNITLAQEESRDMWGFPAIERLLQDARYALRVLIKNPGFSTVAILSLALGIAGSTAIFSIVNGLLIRPLPFHEPGHLFRITNLHPKAVLVYFEQRARTFDVASVSPGFEFNLTGQGPVSRITGSVASVHLFSLLGARAERGWTFEPGEERPGQDGVVIVSNEFWKTRLRGDRDAVGRTLTLAGVARRVVGIMPAAFALPSANAEVWIPASIDPAIMEDYWGGEFVPLIARPRPGATVAQARSEIQSLTAGLWKLFPFPMPRRFNADSTVISLQTDLAGDMRGRLLILLCAVGVVLIIACANVASLLLARATARRKEISMRAALGAGRARIVRQLLTESLVLAFAAGAAGMLLAGIALSLFRTMLPAGLPGLARIGFDWRVGAFAAALSVATGLAFGVVPAWSAGKLELVEAMKTGSQCTTTNTWLALRSWLIAGEIALTLVLVVGAGLLVKSLYGLTAVNPGFSTQRIVTLKISPNDSFCANRAACVAFYNRLLERARGVAGVAGAALANTVPLDGSLPSIPVDVENHPKTADFPAPMLWTGAISPNYLNLMHIPLLSGRAFTNADGAAAARVILISASTAERFWPGVNPIGKHIKPVSEKQWRTIVGVVADVKQFNLADRSPSSIGGAIYMPYAQAVENGGKIPAVMNLLVRTAADGQAASEIRRIAVEANPEIPIGKVIPLDRIVSNSIAGLRSTIWIFFSFVATALLLAAIGIYGLMSYSVAQRTYEISVRMATGATNASIVRLILAQSLRTTLIGMAAGICASFLLTRFLSGMLFRVTATDPLIFAYVCLFLTAVAAAASAIPAWRASRIDPIRTLRAELERPSWDGSLPAGDQLLRGLGPRWISELKAGIEQSAIATRSGIGSSTDLLPQPDIRNPSHRCQHEILLIGRRPAGNYLPSTWRRTGHAVWPSSAFIVFCPMRLRRRQGSASEAL